MRTENFDYRGTGTKTGIDLALSLGAHRDATLAEHQLKGEIPNAGVD